MPSLAEQAQAIADLYVPKVTGAHSAITDDAKVQILLEAVEDGCYLETAAKLAELSKVTVYNWIKRGEAGEPAFVAFLNALQKAEARAEASAIRNVRQAGKIAAHWPAEMTFLERRHPERWGKRQDDASQPKVVVNIGVGMGDVKVGIVAGNNAGLSPDNINDLACGNHSQVEMLSPINSNYVNQPEAAIESVPTLASATDTANGESLRANPAGDPTPVGGGIVGSVRRSGRGCSIG